MNLYDLKDEFSLELMAILDWWAHHMVDPDKGGFYGRIDGTNELHAEANKGVILNTRILWTFSAAARLTNNRQYASLADRAYEYVQTYFLDSVNQGVYWSVDQIGSPVETNKQTYAQAFYLYSLAEYFKLNKDQDVMNASMIQFEILQQKCRDTQFGGYFDAFGSSWTALEEMSVGGSGFIAPKSMNTHLHVMEALTNLARITRNDRVVGALKEIITIFLERIIHHTEGYQQLFFTKDWRVLSQVISFGHDIECSWLLHEAAGVLNDVVLESVSQSASTRLAEITLQRGIDPNNGGLNNEIDEESELDTAKYWWPQAEAVVGFWNAWQMTGNIKYRDQSIKTWRFIQENIIDSEGGEWQWGIDDEEKIMTNQDKAGPWKAPYHNGRMCMEMMERLV